MENHTAALQAGNFISFPGSAGTFSFGARSTLLNQSSTEENLKTSLRSW